MMENTTHQTDTREVTLAAEKKSETLAWRLTKIVVFTGLSIGILLNIIQITVDFLNEKKRSQKILTHIFDASRPTAVEVVYKLDKEGAYQLAEGLLNYDFIEQVDVITDTGAILAHKKRTQSKKSNTLWLSKLFFEEFDAKQIKLFKENNPYAFGELHLQLSVDTIYREFYMRSINLFFSGLLRNMILSLILLTIFYYMLTRPLQRIASFFMAIDPKSMDECYLPAIKGHTNDELAEIIQKANSFLESNRNHFKQLSNANEMIETRSQYMRNILNTTLEGFFCVDTAGIIQDTNPSMGRILGVSRNNIIGRNICEFINDKDSDQIFNHNDYSDNKGQSSYELSFVNSTGAIVPCRVNATSIYSEKKNITGVFAFITDMTESQKTKAEKEHLEAELFQARKMESIGTLAGGIAHDFNNILAAIMGYTEMVKDTIDKDSVINDDLDEVLSAANRGKDLVQQILTFSSQPEGKCNYINLRDIVNDAIKIIRPLLPSNIVISLDIKDSIGTLYADPIEIEQVVINLCTNSYHAMEENGGRLSISLLHMTMQENDLLLQKECEPGDYIRLNIGDTGPGIADDISQRIFDPFFTTKEVGKGTGMGLAIVHGIVKKYSGWIEVKSVKTEGVIFSIYFPLKEDDDNRNSNR